MADITKAPSWQKVLDAMKALAEAKTPFAKKQAAEAREAAISQCVEEVEEVEKAPAKASTSPKPPEPALKTAPSPSAPPISMFEPARVKAPEPKPEPEKEPEIKEVAAVTVDDLLSD